MIRTASTQPENEAALAKRAKEAARSQRRRDAMKAAKNAASAVAHLGGDAVMLDDVGPYEPTEVVALEPTAPADDPVPTAAEIAAIIEAPAPEFSASAARAIVKAEADPTAPLDIKLVGDVISAAMRKGISTSQFAEIAEGRSPDQTLAIIKAWTPVPTICPPDAALAHMHARQERIAKAAEKAVEAREASANADAQARRGLAATRNAAIAAARLVYGESEFEVNKTVRGEWFWGPVNSSKAAIKAAKIEKAAKVENPVKAAKATAKTTVSALKSGRRSDAPRTGTRSEIIFNLLMSANGATKKEINTALLAFEPNKKADCNISVDSRRYAERYGLEVIETKDGDARRFRLIPAKSVAQAG